MQSISKPFRVSGRKHLTSDLLLFAGLVASFLTHESGILLHSVVSLIFTLLIIQHIRRNWRAYRRPPRQSKAVVNQAIALSMALATATGIVLWLAGDKYSLGHGPISVTATILVLPHLWVHRRSLIQLIRGNSPARKSNNS
jgi:glucose-6-phosphate-specific signal transduction histidine kinase